MSGYPVIRLGDEARHAIWRGAIRLGDVIGRTAGDAGGSVLIDQGLAPPRSSRDACFIARRLEWCDPVENAGLKAARHVALKTSGRAACAASESVIMFCAMMRCLAPAVMTDMDMKEVDRGIGDGVNAAFLSLAQRAVSSGVAQQACVAGILSDTDLMPVLGQACEQAGDDGVVLVEEARGTESSVDVFPGMTVEARLLSEIFSAEDGPGRLEMRDSLVLVSQDPLERFEDIAPAMEIAVDLGRPLLVISEDVRAEALQSMNMNLREGILRGAAVRAPGFGRRRQDLLSDIAFQTGGWMFARATGRSSATCRSADLGYASRIGVCERRTSIAVAGNEDDIAARLRSIDAQLNALPSGFDKDKMRERRARLAASLVVLRVGGSCETVIQENASRARAAIAALKLAREGGVIRNAGMSMAVIAQEIDVECCKGDAVSRAAYVAGRAAVQAALRASWRVSCLSAGLDPGWETIRAGGGNYPGSVAERALPRIALETALREAAGQVRMLIMTGAAVMRPPHPEETVFG